LQCPFPRVFFKKSLFGLPLSFWFFAISKALDGFFVRPPFPRFFSLYHRFAQTSFLHPLLHPVLLDEPAPFVCYPTLSAQSFKLPEFGYQPHSIFFSSFPNGPPFDLLSPPLLSCLVIDGGHVRLFLSAIKCQPSFVKVPC